MSFFHSLTLSQVTINNLGLFTAHVACGYLGACANPVDVLPFTTIVDNGKYTCCWLEVTHMCSGQCLF
jgi:hypothetical protein